MVKRVTPEAHPFKHLAAAWLAQWLHHSVQVSAPMSELNLSPLLGTVRLARVCNRKELGLPLPLWIHCISPRSSPWLRSVSW